MSMAVVLDFFEYKFNKRIIVVENPQDRLKDYLDFELSEALRKNNESAITDLINN